MEYFRIKDVFVYVRLFPHLSSILVPLKLQGQDVTVMPFAPALPSTPPQAPT